MEIVVSTIRPWYLSIRLLILRKSLAKRHCINCLLCVVVVSLNLIELHVLGPVSDSCLMGVLGSSLQLLRSILHI